MTTIGACPTPTRRAVESMASAIYAPVVAPPLLEPWRPSIETYRQMAELGVLGDERVELLDGLIVQMSPRGDGHDDAITYLTRLVVESVDRAYLVRPQCGLSLGPRWEPEPDLALVRPGTPKPYHPAAPDWVAEVAVSSLRVDREVKRRAYAEAGIPEYWIVALPERRVDVLSAPAGGDYRRAESVETGVIRSTVIGGLVLDVDDLWRATFG